MKVICNKAGTCRYADSKIPYRNRNGELKYAPGLKCPHGREHHKSTSCRLSCVKHVRRGEKEGAESKCIPIA